MEDAPEACLLCRSLEREPLFERKPWTVFRCRGCGLGFLHPRPTQAELGVLYREGYVPEQYGEGLAAQSAAMKRRLSQEEHRVRFFRKFKKSGRVVDFGCGLGYFLLACRNYGYDVAGVDVSDYAASYMTNELKIPIRVGTLEKIGFADASIDVATMWHFLEHAADPRAYLLRVARWLKPGGLLVVDVPNYLGTDARKMGKDWYGWQVPYHLFHFTPGTLTELLAACGFSVLRTKDYHSECVKNSLKRFPVLGLFARLIAKGFSGTSFAAVTRKAKA